MSGAGRIKYDGSEGEGDFEEGEFLLEVKDAKKSHTLKAAFLRQMFSNAVKQGRWPLLLIRFPGFVAEVRVVPDGKTTMAE